MIDAGLLPVKLKKLVFNPGLGTLFDGMYPYPTTGGKTKMDVLELEFFSPITKGEQENGAIIFGRHSKERLP